MTTENTEQQNAPRKTTCPPFLPWLLAAGAFLVYLITLNHWVTLSSLTTVSKITGWDFTPPYTAPLYLLLTFPIRWLPGSWQPVALNLFSAVCATLSLALLARSVTLMPHDRTRDQRAREHSEFSLLSVRFAWLGPLAAVLVCGLQLTFWENAVVGTSEMLDLLLFAYVIRCLLEYRISQRERWLTKLAVVYGLAVTNNWAMIGFFPLFIISLIWIKGLSFFNLNFLLRMVLFGLAGLLLYLLLPLVNTLSANSDQTFWEVLKANWSFQKSYLLRIPFINVPLLRAHLFMMSLTSLLPLLMISIRWPSFQGDNSPTGALITVLMFRGLHLVFLAVGFWVFFDPKFSPRHLGFGMMPFLTFYFLTALSIGYLIGYVLLVFGQEPANVWERSTGFKRLLSRVFVVLACAALVGVPAGLAYKNLPSIRANNSPALGEYARLTAEALPTKEAVVLSDDATQLLLLEAAFNRLGKKNPHLLLHTRGLTFGMYHTSLYRHYPNFRSSLLEENFVPEFVSDLELIRFLERLSKNHPIYYLQPSFGYYFERFYMKPHGLIYELKPYAPDSLTIPPLASTELAENHNYWTRLKADVFSRLPKETKNPNDVTLVRGYYSRGLNFWGVELQKHKQLAEAGAKFSEAVQLNRDNGVAEINRRFNANLQKGEASNVQIDEAMEKSIGKYGSLEGNLSYNGPFDEINLCSFLGQTFLQGGNYRQAGQQFLRVLDFDPKDFPASVFLSQAYLKLNQPDATLATIKTIRSQQPELLANATNRFHILSLESAAYLSKNDFASAEKILLNERRKNPLDQNFYNLLIQFYFSSGHYTNALTWLDERLKSNPEDVESFRNKGSALLQAKRYDEALTNFNRTLELEPANESALLQKSSLYLLTTNYDKSIEQLDEVLRFRPKDANILIQKAVIHIYAKQFKMAIPPLDQAIKLSPQNSTAYLNRAIVHLQLEDFSAAKKDYEKVRKASPKLPAVYYGLGEIAYHKQDKAEAIKNYKLYLDFAAPDTEEYKKITARLKELELKS